MPDDVPTSDTDTSSGDEEECDQFPVGAREEGCVGRKNSNIINNNKKTAFTFKSPPPPRL